jgi:hypothetical protein
MNASAPSLVRLVNPVGFADVRPVGLAARLDTLAGRTVGFIDNIKPNAGLFLSYVEEMIRADYPDVRTEFVRKNFTSSRLIADQLDGKVHAVVNAWGD